MRLPFRLFLISAVFVPAALFGGQAASLTLTSPIKIGVADYLDAGLSNEFFEETIKALKKEFAPREIEVFNLPAAQLLPRETVDGFDFLIASPLNLQELPTEKNRVIATRSGGEKDGLSASATALVLKERGDIKDWNSLRGVKAATTLPTDLSAWLSVVRELKKEGKEAENFFGSVAFVQHEFPEIFSSLLTGRIDVGFVSACRLEQLEKDGLVPRGRFKVINEKPGAEGECRRSTDRYAGLAFTATQRTDPGDAKKAALAILSMPVSQGNMQWHTATDFTSIRDLLYELELGPYTYLREQSWSALWQKYRWYVFALLGLLLFLLLNEFRLRRTIRIKTEELSRASEERIQLIEQNRLSREKLSAAEHANVVSLLSALVAHELKQPLATLANRLSILKLRLNEALNDDEESGDSVEAMDKALYRASSILNGVRGYARSKPAEYGDCDLTKIISDSIHDLREDHPEWNEVEILVHLPKPSVIYGAFDELRLLFLNLLKNSVREAVRVHGGKVFVSGSFLDEKTLRIEIENDGPPVSEEVYRALCSKMPAMKSLNGGLGLGVALARTIANNHGADLVFSLRGKDGLKVTIDLKRKVSE